MYPMICVCSRSNSSGTAVSSERRIVNVTGIGRFIAEEVRDLSSTQSALLSQSSGGSVFLEPGYSLLLESMYMRALIFCR